MSTAPDDFSPGAMDRDTFLETFGGIYEKSPWIAEQARDRVVRQEPASPEGLHRILREIVDEAGESRQLSLLCAHPDLAGRLAIQGELTPESTSEQASAGLSQCSPEEFAAFQDLNTRYRKKFGFPFILAVRGRTRREILEMFRLRIEHDRETELNEALEQVHEIARLRIEALFP